MSNDTGLIVGRNESKWYVRTLNMSTGSGRVLSKHRGRSSAINAAAEEMKNNPYYEYGIVHIDPPNPPHTKKEDS